MRDYRRATASAVNILLAILLFSASIAAIGLFVVDISDTYNVASNTSLTTFNRMSATAAELELLENRTRTGSVGFLESVDIYFRGALKALISFFNIPGLVGDIASDMQGSGDTGLYMPGWFILLLISATTIVIIAVILRAIFKANV